MVVLTSDPGNEIAEVWSHARDVFVTLLLFCAAAMGVMAIAVNYVARALRRFQAALLRISDGHYDARLEAKGPPEFAALAKGFNHMAEELGGFSRSNRQLYAQLQSVQEEERAGIARDLHDEVGPYLFNLQVDAKAITKLEAPGAARLGQSVREAVIHIQEQVRNMLRQLRPVSQLEFGLEPAIHDLVAFWSRRKPNIRFDLSLALDGRLARSQEEAAYRIAQESISNAVRHGEPALIRIAMTVEGASLRVVVEDDGGGLKEIGNAASLGQSGLAGMRERAEALKGRLDVEEAAHGVRVVALLPGLAEEVAA
jgi:two-component system sensor histidine kinase UhpB